MASSSGAVQPLLAGAWIICGTPSRIEALVLYCGEASIWLHALGLRPYCEQPGSTTGKRATTITSVPPRGRGGRKASTGFCSVQFRGSALYTDYVGPPALLRYLNWTAATNLQQGTRLRVKTSPTSSSEVTCCLKLLEKCWVISI